MVATASLTQAQRLKFGVLGTGLNITDAARGVLAEWARNGRLSSADYASTSGVILELDDDTWVNAPIHDYNPNFVADSPFSLHYAGSFVVEGEGLASAALIWRQPAFHGTRGPHGELNNLVVTHTDRARLSPLRSCAMKCDFCNVPFDDPLALYRFKPLEAAIHAVRTAIDDPIQPARHLLISGGTPKPKDAEQLSQLYVDVITAFPDLPIDIMNVPIRGLFDWHALDQAGSFREVSINLEIFDRDIARAIMPHKYNRGMPFYLDEIEKAAEALGVGRVRSMLLVGLEPLSSTLDGVRAIIERGGKPVLSPFRPDPGTPLSDTRPPTADELLEAFLRAEELAAEMGSELGPGCTPCTHNTLTLAGRQGAAAPYPHGHPFVDQALV